MLINVKTGNVSGLSGVMELIAARREVVIQVMFELCQGFCAGVRMRAK